MNIIELVLENFRNYKYEELNPHSGLNVFYGENAKGKTNLLEGISILINGRSFRTNREPETINFNSPYLNLYGEVKIDNILHKYNYYMDREKKKITVDEKPLNRYRDLKKLGSVVVFTPDDLNMIKNSPSDRRRFLDNLIEGIDPYYLYSNNRYKNVLQERNKLLKQRYNRDFNLLLNIYNLELVKIGSYIYRERLKFIRELNMRVSEIHSSISKESLNITYLSTFPIEQDEKKIRENFLRELERKKDEEIQRGYTLVGPTRDDLRFELSGKNLREFGSQGQIRSTILSIKLAESKIIKDKSGYNPILLLDDVFSELDFNRKNFLMESIKDQQCFITTVEPIDELRRIFKGRDARIYKIDNGISHEESV